MSKTFSQAQLGDIVVSRKVYSNGQNLVAVVEAIRTLPSPALVVRSFLKADKLYILSPSSLGDTWDIVT